MIHVINLKAVLVRMIISAVLISVAIQLGLTKLAIPGWPVPSVFTIVSSVASAMIALSASNAVWRPLRRFIARWDTSIYPDLNGIWEGTIQPSPGEGESTIESLPITARVRQSALEIYIDFYGETFESATISAVPSINRGQHYLHYIYSVESKNPQWPSYDGTAILRAQAIGTGKERCWVLNGKYHTARKTIGRIHLKQISGDPDKEQDINYHQNNR